MTDRSRAADAAATSSSTVTCPTVTRLVGVYDADSTVRGELSYWIGARLGRRHCSLCDITHGSVRQRPEWRACRAELAVPFDTFHRNDQPDSVRAAAGGRAPVVVVETDAGTSVLLDDDQIEACDGSVDRLMDAIDAEIARRGLCWSAADCPTPDVPA